MDRADISRDLNRNNPHAFICQKSLWVFCNQSQPKTIFDRQGVQASGVGCCIVTPGSLPLPGSVRRLCFIAGADYDIRCCLLDRYTASNDEIHARAKGDRQQSCLVPDAGNRDDAKGGLGDYGPAYWLVFQQMVW